nr:Peptidyl-prolyl cis-trans isomerase FKBP4, N-terminally processed like [Ipomoea batatas]
MAALEPRVLLKLLNGMKSGDKPTGEHRSSLCKSPTLFSRILTRRISGRSTDSTLSFRILQIQSTLIFCLSKTTSLSATRCS